MSDVVTGTPPGGNDDDLVAAEYVLGTLDLDERMAFVDRLREDATARAAVAAWERRFEAIAGQVGESAPPTNIWTRIEAALFASPSRVTDFRVLDGGRTGYDRADRARLETSRNRWRTAAVLAGTLAAALAIFVGTQLPFGAGPQPAETYIAAINRGGDKPALIVRVDLKTQKVYVKPVAAETPAGRSLELWYIDGGKPPKSLGLVQEKSETLEMPQGTAAGTTTFAVSVEPTGGSKTGSPTGPVVYSGQLVAQ